MYGRGLTRSWIVAGAGLLIARNKMRTFVGMGASSQLLIALLKLSDVCFEGCNGGVTIQDRVNIPGDFLCGAEISVLAHGSWRIGTIICPKIARLVGNK
jgi:hypothetical protein